MFEGGLSSFPPSTKGRLGPNLRSFHQPPPVALAKEGPNYFAFRLSRLTGTPSNSFDIQDVRPPQTTPSTPFLPFHHSHMLKGVMRCGTMPMLDAFGDGDTLSREQFLRLFTPDLVIALPCRSQKDLAGPIGGRANVCGRRHKVTAAAIGLCLIRGLRSYPRKVVHIAGIVDADRKGRRLFLFQCFCTTATSVGAAKSRSPHS